MEGGKGGGKEEERGRKGKEDGEGKEIFKMMGEGEEEMEGWRKE